MIKDYKSEMRNEAVKMFLDIYNNPPFSFEWINFENVRGYFEELEQNPSFCGFVCENNGTAEGFCFGKISGYFQTKKYYINEVFIRRDIQGNGKGSEFIGTVAGILAERKISAIEINTDKRSEAYKFYSKMNFIDLDNVVTMVMPCGKK